MADYRVMAQSVLSVSRRKSPHYYPPCPDTNGQQGLSMIPNISGRGSGSPRGTTDLVEPAAWDASLPVIAQPVRPIVRRLNKVASWAILILSLAGIVSFSFSNFVPSHITVQVAKAMTLVIGTFYGLFFHGVGHFGWDKRNPAIRAYAEEHRKMAKAYVRVPFMAAVFAGFAWISFANVFPWMINAAIGERGTMIVMVDGWESASYSFRGGHSCARPTVRGIPFAMLGRRALCVGDQRRQSDFPSGTSLALIGRVSALGIAPDHYRVLSRGPGT